MLLSKFCCGCRSLIDAKRAGCPVKVAAPEKVGKRHDMLLADHGFRVRKFEETIGLSHGSVVSIWDDPMGMRKLSVRWVSQKQSYDNFEEVFSVVRLKFGRNLVPLYNPGRILGKVNKVQQKNVNSLTIDT